MDDTADTAELVIDFAAGGNSEGYRRSGWYAPEPRHSWTQGIESSLEFPRPNVPGAYLMLLELGPFVWPEKLPVQRPPLFRWTGACRGWQFGSEAGWEIPR